MPLTEKKAISNARYDATHTVRTNFKFNKGTDADILEWLDKQPSKLGAVKAAIRAAIAAEKKEQ